MTTTLDAMPAAGLYLVGTDLLGTVDEAEAFIDDLEDDPDVSEVHVNFVGDTPEGVRQMIIAAVGGDFTDYEDQSLLERIERDAAHALSTGLGTTVAVLDTGIDPDHEAFVGRLAPGYDFVDGDPDPREVMTGLDQDGDGLTDEGFGHGTMVAGIVSLVAPDATVVPVRVLDAEGRCDAFRVVQGIEFAIASGVDLINLSLGVPLELPAVAYAVERAKELGVLVVAAAGNESRSEPPYHPAASDEAMMVAAADSLDRRAAFSDYGSEVDVGAPGTGVRSAYPDGQWAIGDGCSFATPFVTGALALARARYPLETREELIQRVLEGVDPVVDAPPGGDAWIGSGRINLRAVLAPDYLSVGAPAPGAGLRLVAAPNPARSWPELRLEGSGEPPSDGTVLGVYTPDGREAARVAWSDRATLADRRWARGIYFLQLRSSAGITISRRIHVF